MFIRLEHLIPLPMIELDTSGSQVWEADSFLFESGKRYLVEASSGKGKTSLLSIMYGIRRDFQGQVYLDDQPIVSFSDRRWSEIRKHQLSYIFQGLQLFEDLTGLQNIELKNRITRFKTTEEIQEMARQLDIAPFIHKKAKHLSFGQRQRVAIIRALCQPFAFLLADECFSHIDRKNSQVAMELVTSECDRQGAGLILTTLDNSTFKFDEHIQL